jgi:hypothetical protein
VGKWTDYSLQSKIDFQREDREKRLHVQESRMREKQRRVED